MTFDDIVKRSNRGGWKLPTGKVNEPQAKPRFEVLAAARKNELDVWLYGVIGDDFSEDGVIALSIVKELAASKAKTINVFINSPGGNVFDGIAIFNALERHSARVIVHVDGAALSIASLIAMAGDEIIMAENAMMMLHKPFALVVGDAEKMRHSADMMDKIADLLVETYAARTSRPQSEITSVMAAETWFDAQEAVDAGLADSIVEAKKVAAYGDLSKFKNVPEGVTAARRGLAQEKEAAMPEKNEAVTAVAQEVRAATYAEITEGCQGATDQFICSQLKVSATMDQARAAWDKQTVETIKAHTERLAEQDKQIAEMKAEAAKEAPEMPGSEPVGVRTGDTTANIGETFPQAVARYAANGVPRPKAAKMARAENMDRWERYVEDANK